MSNYPRVKIFDVAADGTETFRCEAMLDECYEMADELMLVGHELETHGEYVDGGGAAPLVRLVLVRE
jgi:hypothetical protein